MAAFVEDLLDAFHARTPIRAGSLIVTVFGDCVVPRGGEIWLGSLFEIMRAFRINDGLVRTAMSRLVADGWLERRRVGRNSYYRLTMHGRATFSAAAARIYGSPDRPWDGVFELALLEPGSDRRDQRQALEAQGYGAVTPDLMIAPVGSSAANGEILHLRATASDPEAARRLAARAWPMADLEERYAHFVRTFAPAGEALDRGTRLTPLVALVVRILLIHEYRRIVLRDPLLPAALLPERWSGDEARALCGRIYRTVVGPAEGWLDAHAETETGPLPRADGAVLARFSDKALRP